MCLTGQHSIAAMVDWRAAPGYLVSTNARLVGGYIVPAAGRWRALKQEVTAREPTVTANCQERRSTRRMQPLQRNRFFPKKALASMGF